MKLTIEQKLRIARFHDLNPQVSHQDIADLFGVSRTTITGIVKSLAVVCERRRKQYIHHRYDQLENANTNEPPF